MKAADSPLVSKFNLITAVAVVDNCPQGQDVVTEITFDPWSLYVPLSIEPRLDIMIINNLKSGGATAQAEDKMSMAHNITKRSIASESGMPLPTLPLGSSQAYQGLAWNAAINGLPSLELPSLVIEYPKIARSPRSVPPISHTPVPQSGFVLEGEVHIFGGAVVGNLQKWMGPPPHDVVVGIEAPSIERVAVQGDFRLSTLIPLLRGTPFDDIIFRNVAIYHQNYAFDKTKSIGWHFSADWVIDTSCGLLYNILTQVLGVSEPVLSIHAFFGELQQWSTPLNIHSFILEGVFASMKLSPVSGLTLTSIGVRLLGIRGFSFSPEPHSTLSFGFDIFGTMKLDVPGSVVPLDLHYEMGLAGSTVNLTAEISGEIWEDALGVKGLMVSYIWRVDALNPHKSVARKCCIRDIVFRNITLEDIFIGCIRNILVHEFPGIPAGLLCCGWALCAHGRTRQLWYRRNQ